VYWRKLIILSTLCVPLRVASPGSLIVHGDRSGIPGQIIAPLDGVVSDSSTEEIHLLQPRVMATVGQAFRKISSRVKKSEEYQIKTLVYTMGDAAEDILRYFSLTDEDLKSYETVLAKFHGYFVKKRNVIFESAKFNQRRQLEGESVDDFITSLQFVRVLQLCTVKRGNDSGSNRRWSP